MLSRVGEADSLAWEPGAVRARGEGRRATGLEPRPDGAPAPRATRTHGGARSPRSIVRSRSAVRGGMPESVVRILNVFLVKSRGRGSRNCAAERGAARAALLFLLVWTVPANADEKRSLTDADAATGRTLYLQECSPCHGERGDGAGPRAKMARCTPLRDRSIDARINQ
jgi:mono/diheme cytochrome c family protein